MDNEARQALLGQVEKARHAIDSTLTNDAFRVVMVTFDAFTNIMQIHTINTPPELAQQMMHTSLHQLHEFSNRIDKGH